MADPQFKNVIFQPVNQADAAFKAGTLIDRAFKSLSGTVKDIEKGERANVDAKTEGNTQNIIRGMKSNTNLDTFDTDAGKLVSRLTQESADAGVGFDLAAINEAMSTQKVKLQESRGLDQAFKLSELDIEGKTIENEVDSLLAAAKPKQIEAEQTLRDENVTLAKNQNAVAEAAIAEQIRVTKVGQENRAAVSEFRGIQHNWIEAHAAKIAGKTLTTDQEELVAISATDLVRNFVASPTFHGDAATAQAIVQYQKDMVGFNAQTPEQIVDAQTKLAEQAQNDKLAVQKLKNEGNLNVAKLRAKTWGANTKGYKNTGTGLINAQNDVIKKLPADLADDWGVKKIRTYSSDVFKNWKKYGFAQQPSVDTLAAALELGVNLEFSDDLIAEDIINKKTFINIVKEAESGDANVDSMIDFINAEHLARSQAQVEALRQSQAEALRLREQAASAGQQQ
ncbi:MAG: hypothetical protein GY829_15685 [Gammaproteobacteria bacterium]|nr:hypothetical protein [Gammaproteobacteria bacterium]